MTPRCFRGYPTYTRYTLYIYLALAAYASSHCIFPLRIAFMILRNCLVGTAPSYLGLLSSLWVPRTRSAFDWCALQEALYKCIYIYNKIQYCGSLNACSRPLASSVSLHVSVFLLPG